MVPAYGNPVALQPCMRGEYLAAFAYPDAEAGIDAPAPEAQIQSQGF